MVENLLLREWLNEILVPLTFCLLVIVTHSLWTARREFGPHRWRDVAGVSSACALWWLFLTELSRAVNAWVILHRQNNGEGLSFVVTSTPALIYLGIGLIAVAATFRLIHTLSPPAWGHKGWMAALAFVLGFVIFVESGMLSWLTGGIW